MTSLVGFSKREPWQDTAHSIEFKRQVAQEYLSGEMPRGLAKRHDITRNLIP
ncbi:hypothetical protein [Mesorhizobium sp. LCM 4577]|uniref:hypothetical protein n=1 Tax=Mesorhizobium sp. LCM 4577 TaxID=1848288 RepID=UPI001FCE2C58|nr:hypothetical protein [Mesorhizobium sp. LCM 4577]